jgi:hypothetical protein
MIGDEISRRSSRKDVAVHRPITQGAQWGRCWHLHQFQILQRCRQGWHLARHRLQSQGWRWAQWEATRQQKHPGVRLRGRKGWER